MMFFLPSNDTDTAIAFDKSLFYFRNIIQALFTELHHQFIFRDEFLTHITPQHPAIAHQRQRRWLDQATERLRAEAQPIEKIIPKDDGCDQYDSIRNRIVLTGHGVLGSIGK